ncbi:ATP-binding protein [Methyloceanibacter marginalis]|uniref:ATP-binding protein n=1 Tax=Methyloceanibacter marginalis TaxID=1774971 RepID=A0A1E3W801_9HYPH|nr:sce7725 family protein [Methyloceanibacter marginalis]ODS01933.1 ATP-binding protein [Methyloceanibacter marginalis]
MYHPFFRGKQFELITIRENAELLAASNFVPIIEPVKEPMSGLERTLDAVCSAGGSAVTIVNPHHGVLADSTGSISDFLAEKYLPKPEIAAGILLKDYATTEEALECWQKHKDHQITFIHAGFTDAKALANALGSDLGKTRHIFFQKKCGTLYRRHFEGCQRVLLNDGFIQRRNRDHPDVPEFFSDLHITYQEEGMDGFGDFLTVGDEFYEAGGPAYTIAIHITFIDPDNDNAMYIHHFKSKRQDTPADPAGKFAEALDGLIRHLDSPDSKILETEAIKEFRLLHAKRHYPGLGYVKKLSMQHHIETLADYLG